jgi:hypothetical protein
LTIGEGARWWTTDGPPRWRSRVAVACLLAIAVHHVVVEAPPASAASSNPVQGEVCLISTNAAALGRLFDTEPGGVVGADYQRAHPLGDGRVLWLFQDAAVRRGPDDITIVHNIAVVQEGSCFEVRYGGTRSNPRPFLFPQQTDPYERWFWPLGAEIGVDGRLYVFVAEMVERGEKYLTETTPVATRVAVYDPITDEVVTTTSPANASAALYGWSVASDRQWTYLYANCYRQFGYDQYRGVAAHDQRCAPRVTLGRVPRGDLLAAPNYWDGSGWQPDPARAVAVYPTAGRVSNANQIVFTGSSFMSVNKPGDWWGNEIEIARSEHPAGPFTIIERLSLAPKCPECNTFFASWIPPDAIERPRSRLVFGIAHNRWDGRITALYRPSFHEVHAPPFLAAGRALEVVVPGVDAGGVAVLNVTAVAPVAAGHVTAFACDRSLPTASNLNYVAGDVVANLVMVRADAAGRVCVSTHATTDLVVDHAGNLPAGAVVAQDSPVRLVDTRRSGGRVAAGGVLEVVVPGVDAGGVAVLNVTAVAPVAAGHVTAFACDRSLPTASNLNYRAGDVVANLVMVRPDASGRVCLFTHASTDLVVDHAGNLPPGAVVPQDNPTRLADTRTYEGITR